MSSVLFFDYMIKKLYFSVFLVGLIICQSAFPVIPVGYYNGTDGFSGSDLKTQLSNTIKVHTVLLYGDLWSAFQFTDKRADDKVWDIYSNNTNYMFGTNQDKGSGGRTEGEFYNREHSFPNSWFGGVSSLPMYTDLFHLYPSDKWVNAQRGNSSFGNVQTVTDSSANGYSRWGTSSESGSLLTVFEPADEMKGDLARSYFYIVSCYEDVVATWRLPSPNQTIIPEMLTGNSYPAFKSWAIKVLLEWSRLDPVSAKERARNDVIYTNYQHNRNPYIDYPSLAEYVWGDSTTYAFHPANYLPASTVKTIEPTFHAWSENGLLHVRASAGKRIEIVDETGRLVVRSVSQQAETTLLVGAKRFVLVRVENQVQKVVL
jgi:endonuclease I